MNLTFVTWNIRSGRIDDGRDERLRHQMELLAGLGPSVVTLQFSYCRAFRDVSDLLNYVADMSVTLPGARLSGRGRAAAPWLRICASGLGLVCVVGVDQVVVADGDGAALPSLLALATGSARTAMR